MIDMLDMNDVTQLMEGMGISTHHRLVLKATFAGWKKNPDAAFEALAEAKVALRTALLLLLLLLLLLRHVCEQASAAKKAQEEAAAAQKKVRTRRCSSNNCT